MTESRDKQRGFKPLRTFGESVSCVIFWFVVFGIIAGCVWWFNGGIGK